LSFFEVAVNAAATTSHTINFFDHEVNVSQTFEKSPELRVVKIGKFRAFVRGQALPGARSEGSFLLCTAL
jgi:hypothetical protein